MTVVYCVIEAVCLTPYRKNTLVEALDYEVEKNASWRQVIDDLSERQIYHTPFALKAYVLISGQWFRLKAGEYVIKPGYSFRSLVDDMVHGRQKMYRLSIIPGMSWVQLRARIADLPFSQRDDVEMFKDPSWEGYFYPDTYFFTKNYPLAKVLQQARKASFHHIQEVYAHRDASLASLTVAELVIIASIIEREAATSDDRPKIARVIYNRLAQHMPLQIDATMVHVTINEGAVFNAQSLRRNHPYNTYKIQGLPPGPIAYPSLASLYAAAHPETGDWLFYRLECGESHVFTHTFEAHKMVKKCR